MGSVEIRSVDDKDFDIWLPLWMDYQRFYEADIPASVTRGTWERFLDPREPLHAALAMAGRHAVGLVHSVYHRSTWTTEDYCYLQDLFVAGDARGGGIGRALIEHVYADAKRRGAARVYWLTHEENRSTMQLYDRIADRSGFIQYRKPLKAPAPGPMKKWPTTEKKMLLPRQPVPGLRVPTLAHGEFDLADDAPERFTLICFYRGLHCPICLKYLRELGSLVPEFERRGTKVIAISSDSPERTQELARKVGADDLRFGHSLPLTAAREWGLYISSSRGKSSINIEEPALFSEPGVFLVRPDGTLYYGAVQTMPFARPVFVELLQAIDFAITRDYPARGEYDGPL